MYVFRECFIIKLLIVILMNMPAIRAHQGKILTQTIYLYINSIVIAAAAAFFHK